MQLKPFCICNSYDAEIVPLDYVVLHVSAPLLNMTVDQCTRVKRLQLSRAYVSCAEVKGLGEMFYGAMHVTNSAFIDSGERITWRPSFVFIVYISNFVTNVQHLQLKMSLHIAS